MSYQPDDPANPTRPKPPGLGKLHWSPDQEMKELAARFRGLVHHDLESMRELDKAAREFIGYAFIAEVGLPASQVTLCEKQDATGIKIWFEARTGQSMLEMEVSQLRDQVRRLTVALHAAESRKADR